MIGRDDGMMGLSIFLLKTWVCSRRFERRANLGAAKIMRHWPPQQSTPNSIVAALSEVLMRWGYTATSHGQKKTGSLRSIKYRVAAKMRHPENG